MHKRIQRESSSWSHTCYGYETHNIQFWLFYKVYNLVPPSSFTMLCTVSVVYFQLCSTPQEQNVNHEKSLPILCPPPPLPWSIHSSTSCIYGFSSGQFSSVAQSCPTLWDPMKCSTSGHPVQQLPEFTQTHIHWVGDAIQPSHPLSSPSPPAFNLSQHQGLFKWVSSLHQVAKVLEFLLQLKYFPMNIQDWFPLGWTGWVSCSPKDTQESSPTPQFKSTNSLGLSFLYSPTLTSIHDYWKNHSFD